MADVEYLKSLLGVHPDWPKKVSLVCLIIVSFALTEVDPTCRELPFSTFFLSYMILLLSSP